MRFSVSALGMITSVGHNVETTGASVRAGIACPMPMANFPVLENETQTMVPVTGHPVFAVTEGFSHVGRWLQMALRAVADLVRDIKIPENQTRAFWDKTALSIITPVLDDDRFLFAFYSHPIMFRDVFVQPLLALLGCDIARDRVRLFHEGRTGAIDAIQQAGALFSERDIDRLIVISVDSLLDDFSLQWLAEQGRLKTDGNPAGLFPGEACAAVMLESDYSIRKRGGKALARICSAATDREAGAYLDEKPFHGRAVARCLNRVLSSCDRLPFCGELIVDLNGETWRAYEFGAGLAQIPSEKLGDMRLVFPATSMGDTGAASTAVAIGMGIQTNIGDRHASADCLIISISPSGRTGALLLKMEEKHHG